MNEKWKYVAGSAIAHVGIDGYVATVYVSARGRTGIAFCSPRDPWDREKGVQIAAGRATDCILDSESDPRVLVAHQVLDGVPAPDRVRKLLRLAVSACFGRVRVARPKLSAPATAAQPAGGAP